MWYKNTIIMDILSFLKNKILYIIKKLKINGFQFKIYLNIIVITKIQ